MYVEKRLKPTWDWILIVMEATEAQLRFGASLTDSTDTTHPLHPLNTPSTTTTSNNNNNTNTSSSGGVMGVLGKRQFTEFSLPSSYICRRCSVIVVVSDFKVAQTQTLFLHYKHS